jgi:hypothetical protein
LNLGFNLFLNCTFDSDKLCFEIRNETVCFEELGYVGSYNQKNVASTSDVSLIVPQVNFTAPGGALVVAGGKVEASVTHAVPFVIRNPLNFTSCSASYGDQNCGCEICGPASFQLNCTNITVATLGSEKFKFPDLPCIGLQNFTNKTLVVPN